jgi:hypothetical protein
MFALNQAWHDVFVPSHSLLEMFVRSSIMYTRERSSSRSVIRYTHLTGG